MSPVRVEIVSILSPTTETASRTISAPHNMLMPIDGASQLRLEGYLAVRIRTCSSRLAKTFLTDPGRTPWVAHPRERAVPRKRRDARPAEDVLNPCWHACAARGRALCACATPSATEARVETSERSVYQGVGLDQLGTHRFHGSEVRDALSSESWPSERRTEVMRCVMRARSPQRQHKRSMR